MNNTFEHTPNQSGSSAGSRRHRDTKLLQILTPGEQIGKLRIEGHVGTGGMAEIYKARHEELEVIRAVKILKPGYTQEDKARFQTEAKISAHLQHQNIVQIFTVDTWEDTLPYIEMEYVEGQSLAQLIRQQRRLPADFALAVGAIVCSGLEYAQKQNFTVYGNVYSGLVHRDIKPANILLSKNGTVKLADFGIALPGNTSLHTVGPNTMGTYAYLSPEQLEGKALDQRSDIYSLGIVLYEMLAGFKAFPDTHNLPELVRNKLNGTYRPVQSLVPNLPKALIKIIDKSLCVDRKKRYEEVGEFGTALRRALSDMNNLGPEAVVVKYLQNPTKDFLGLSGQRFSFFGSDWAIPVLAGSAVLSFIIAAIIWKNSFSVYEPAEADVATAQEHSITQVDKPVQKAARTQPVPKSAAKSKRPAPQKKPQQIARAQTTAAKQEIPPEEKALASIPAPKPPPQPVQREEELSPLAQIQHIEECLQKGQPFEAIDYAESHKQDDGYYHLLRGKAHFMAGNYSRAEDALNKAQTTRSRYNTNVKREATYLWASNRSAIYRKKPNVNNKKVALKAWQNFQRVFCKDGSADRECSEAGKKIAKLEQ